MSKTTAEELAEELDELERAAHEMRPEEPPGPRGPQARRRRLAQARGAAATKQPISIRLDVDTLQRLKVLAGEGSYQALINRALAQWCDAMEVGALLEDKLVRLEQAAARLEALEQAPRQAPGDDESEGAA